MQDNTLGLPKLCTPENLHKIDRDVLFAYLSQHYTPKRMVVAGVGVEHPILVEAVQKYFVDVAPLWESESGMRTILNQRKNLSCDRSVAQYTGGFVQVWIITRFY
ncbi:hypothetical protein NQ314_019745 [Rhamnusium bicolor]|uniref:Peptidase M16 C-terminal domain-containing protein n=1 Tax=Rhamnusium bicolor TaxID=1586634 RepID=A0AAV8WN83_9CUCU|nr:hypothetical protein NQ314_019745 [Rhamnusium bicolor]